MAVFVDGADDDGTVEVVFKVGEAGGEFCDETGSIYSKQHPHHQFRIRFFFARQITKAVEKKPTIPSRQDNGHPSSHNHHNIVRHLPIIAAVRIAPVRITHNAMMRPPLDHNIPHHRLKNLRGPRARRPEFHHHERGVFCRAGEHTRGFGSRAGGVAAEIFGPWGW